MTEITNERTDRFQGMRWYAVHTYSGHENKVKTKMEQLVKSRGMEDVIEEIVVPTEEYTEEKDGATKVKERKLYPSYVFIKMIMTDESWYLVRNTQGVTGFVGPGSKPVPLSEEEGKSLGVIRSSKEKLHFDEGESVKIKSGPFKDFLGTIESVDDEKEKARVFISMFGRDTKLELDYSELEKL